MANQLNSSHGDISVIDCIRHQLTGVQMLWALSEHWNKTGNPAAILLIKRGRSASIANTLRVNLTREREKRGTFRSFEIRFSDPIPTTYRLSDDVLLDAEHLIVRRSTERKSTQIGAALQALRLRDENESKEQAGD